MISKIVFLFIFFLPQLQFNNISFFKKPTQNKKEEEIVITEKEVELLKLLHSRDTDAETAIRLLYITESELKTMIHKLIDFEMLHYVSSDVVELSEIGINYLMTNEKEKN